MHRSFVALLVSLLCGGASAAGRQWIMFRDKGPGTQDGVLRAADRTRAEATITPRALRRRAKSLPPESLVDVADLPVYQPYLDSLKRVGLQPVVVSRWFNAVSVELPESQSAAIRSMPFVRTVAPVGVYHGPNRIVDRGAVEYRSSLAKPALAVVDSLDYAGADAQARLSHIDSLQGLGITGNDVLLGMLDSGCRWRVHSGIDDAHVLGEYDFVQHDSIIANDSLDDPGQDWHGTLTFSTISCWLPGTMIGGAYNAGFLLAKTEDIRTETHAEEDNYAAALEWMEGRGVDVTSSSLTYSRFDSGQVSYTMRDMDGRTTIVAKAVQRAARLGVCVVTAAGNNGQDTLWPYVRSPGDADSDITAGAVDSTGTIAAFSARGPTADGRIKPDMCAQGVSAYGVDAGNPNGFTRVSGTSLSTPILAGCAALMLSAHPEMTNIQVRDALRASGDHASHPDTAYGWGVADVYRAALASGPLISNPPRVTRIPETGGRKFTCGIAALDGIADASVSLFVAGSNDAAYRRFSMRRVGGSDLFVAGVDSASVPFSGDSIRFFITAQTGGGQGIRAPHGGVDTAYTVAIADTIPFRSSPLDAIATASQFPDDYTIIQNYPNPFHGTTDIRIGAPARRHATVEAYSVLGQRCAMIFSGDVLGYRDIKWNAGTLPPGVYFVWLRTSAGSRSIMVEKTN